MASIMAALSVQYFIRYNKMCFLITEVCGRWAYPSFLCFALDLDEQRHSRFHYRYSAYQIEYGRNLLFTRGTALDAVLQGLIDRTRRHLDVPKLQSIFGYKTRPHHLQGKKPVCMARVLDQPPMT